MTEVVIVGGHHDGLEGEVAPVCIEQRCVVEVDGDLVYLYVWDGAERDRRGRPVFRPNRRRAAGETSD